MPKTDEQTVGRTEPPEVKLLDPATVLNLIRKWNLHFEGKDPFAFLEHLAELKNSHRYPNKYLLLGLHELLRGDPLLWYRNNHEDWNDFC